MTAAVVVLAVALGGAVAALVTLALRLSKAAERAGVLEGRVLVAEAASTALNDSNAELERRLRQCGVALDELEEVARATPFPAPGPGDDPVEWLGRLSATVADARSALAAAARAAAGAVPAGDAAAGTDTAAAAGIADGLPVAAGGLLGEVARGGRDRLGGGGAAAGEGGADVDRDSAGTVPAAATRD